METVEKSISIDAPQEVVWKAIADFQGIGEFHPYIKTVDLLTENNGGLGSKRTCHFNDGSDIDEEIIEWVEGEKYTINGSNFSLPLKVLHGTVGVRTVDGMSEAYMKIEYQPKFGLIGKLMSTMLMKRALSKRIEGVLAGLNYLITNKKRVPRAA